jgi:hypothetical protein
MLRAKDGVSKGCLCKSFSYNSLKALRDIGE